MTPDTLAKVGRALFGELWQSAMARLLMVSDRSVRFWLAGDRPVPKLEGELLEAIANKEAELREARRLLAP